MYFKWRGDGEDARIELLFVGGRYCGIGSAWVGGGSARVGFWWGGRVVVGCVWHVV